jgi:transposase-like protein
MDKEAAVLRRELERVEKGRGRRYPEQLRKRVVAWSLARHESGESWEQITRELGRRGDTIRRWCTERPDPSSSSRAMVPVRVVPDAHSGRALTVVSPAGFRVDGLTLAEAAALLRELE